MLLDVIPQLGVAVEVCLAHLTRVGHVVSRQFIQMLASHVTLEVKKPLGVMPGAIGADESRVDAVLFQQMSDQKVVVTEGLGTRGAEKGHRQVVLIPLLHFLLSIAAAGGQVWSLQYSNMSLFYRQGSLCML